MIWLLTAILLTVITIATRVYIIKETENEALRLSIENKNSAIQKWMDKTNEYKQISKDIISSKTYKKQLDRQLELEKELELYEKQVEEFQYGFNEDEEQDWCVESIGGYKELIKDQRDAQKSYSRNGMGIDFDPITSELDWDENMKLQKLILSSFNSFCDKTLGNCRNKNKESIEKLITKEYEKINKICPFELSISELYLESKIDEASIRIELEHRRGDFLLNNDEENIEEELSVYEDGIAKAKEGIERANELIESDSEDDIKKGKEIKRLLEEKLVELEKRAEEDKEILKNKKKGWVYCISSPSLPNIVKLGLTRRAIKERRIEELSGSSIPFEFVAHAWVETDDCFKLEGDLHRAFSNQRVNTRREHFYVSTEEVQKKLTELGYDITFKHNIIHDDYERNKKRLEDNKIYL